VGESLPENWLFRVGRAGFAPVPLKSFPQAVWFMFTVKRLSRRDRRTMWAERESAVTFGPARIALTGDCCLLRPGSAPLCSPVSTGSGIMWTVGGMLYGARNRQKGFGASQRTRRRPVRLGGPDGPFTRI
jgi:hypothetical protein